MREPGTVLGRVMFCCVAVIAVAASAQSGVSRVCRVSTNAGAEWTDEVTREVTFMSGAELNRAFKTDHFERSGTYAVLSEGPSSVVLLKLDDGFSSRGLRFDAPDFRQLFASTETVSFVQMDSREASRWKIRARSGRRYFDSRVR